MKKVVTVKKEKVIYMKPDSDLVSLALFLPKQLEDDFAKLCREWYAEDDEYYNTLNKMKRDAELAKEHSGFQRSQTRLCRLLRQYEGTAKEDRLIQEEVTNV
jgi:hypothetical protein